MIVEDLNTIDLHVISLSVNFPGNSRIQTTILSNGRTLYAVVEDLGEMKKNENEEREREMSGFTFCHNDQFIGLDGY